MANLGRSLLATLGLGLLLAQGDARGAEPMPAAAFFPDGRLGLQLGSSWAATKRVPALNRLTCERADGGSFEEVCFFRTANQVGGATIHDGFIARKGDRVVLIGTGIAIKDADDPLVETVLRELEPVNAFTAPTAQ